MVEGRGDGVAHGSFITNLGTNQAFLISLSSQMVNKLRLAMSWLVLNPDRTPVTKQSNDSTHILVGEPSSLWAYRYLADP